MNPPIVKKPESLTLIYTNKCRLSRSSSGCGALLAVVLGGERSPGRSHRFRVELSSADLFEKNNNHIEMNDLLNVINFHAGGW
jgi:hypothetical protein